MKWWMLALVGATGCLQANDNVLCPDGRTCPEGSSCATITMPEEKHLCLTPEEASACAGVADFTDCSTKLVAAGRCYEGVCQVAGCGNHILDPEEQCDDGNQAVGDGCSYDCKSLETCGNNFLDPVQISEDTMLPTPRELCDDGARFGHDGCGGTCQPEQPLWQQIGGGAPPARQHHMLAYDSYRGRVVVFGGTPNNGGDQFDDTWLYDGQGWVQLPTLVRPAGRHSGTMVYDQDTRHILLFGGLGGESLNDLWELDGDVWRELVPSDGVRPPGRWDAQMVYDAKRKRVVLYGGNSDTSGNYGTSMYGVLRDDTWEWDGSKWTMITNASTGTARWGHTMIYDPVRGVTVLAGGRPGLAGSTVIQGTWEYDGAWTMKSASSPGQLCYAAGAYDPISMKPMVQGGEGSGKVTTTFVWNGSTWTSAAGLSGPSRSQHAMATDFRRGFIVLFGGNVTGITPAADTWERTGAGWSSISTPGPGTRILFGSAYDQQHGRAVIFGGMSAIFGTPLADTWIFDGSHWKQGPSGPTGRWAPAMAGDTKRGRIILFGGEDASAVQQGDTWIFDGTWNALGSSAPPGRWESAMAYDAKRDRVVMFGGSGSSGSLGDTWEFDGATWTERTPASGSPMPRYNHKMAYDPLRERVVMIGGIDGERIAWEWDGTNWTATPTMAPPPSREGGALAWNPARQSLILFSGRSAPADTWERRGTDWERVYTASVPPKRTWGSMFPAPDGSGVLVHGGWLEDTNTPLADTWLLRWDSLEPYESCTGDVDDDGDGDVGCADVDCWARCTPLCLPGTACDPARPHCGDGTCDSVEDCRLCPADCASTCAVRCGDGYCDPSETAAGCPSDC